MRVVVAPDSFKECLPAHEVARAMAAGVRRAAPDAEIREVPMADGGQGTVEALVRATVGRFLTVQITGPMGEPVTARYGLFGDESTAVIEMAAAAGLELVPPEKRDALAATTYGVGELLCAALDLGVRRIIVGIGGSATTDGGAGCAEALGFRLLDAAGDPIPRGGGGLASIARIDASRRHPRLAETRIDVACDVTNPLFGPEGAACVYGPQKGASPRQVELLDAALAQWATVLQRDLGSDVANNPGAGAAGGLGAGLMACCGATLGRGVELVIDAVKFREQLAGAVLCLTGEGSLDDSSRFGKTVSGVAAAAAHVGVPVVALAGRIKPEAAKLLEVGVTAYFAIAPGPSSNEESSRNAAAWLADTAEQVTRLVCAKS